MGQDSRRTHPRVATNIEATLRLPDGRTATAGQILNISLGGVFIEMEQPLSFGAELDIEFAVPGAHVKCKGLVVWSTKSAPHMGHGREGIGVRLMNIGVREMRSLASYIQERLET